MTNNEEMYRSSIPICPKRTVYQTFVNFDHQLIALLITQGLKKNINNKKKNGVKIQERFFSFNDTKFRILHHQQASKTALKNYKIQNKKKRKKKQMILQ